MPAAGAHDDGMEGWMVPGFEMAFLGTGTGSASRLDDPTRWTYTRYTVLAVDEQYVTLFAEGIGAGASDATTLMYDRESRRLTNGRIFAVLWVDDADIAAGEAWIGDRFASYVHSTPWYHMFASGGTQDYFDPETGVLLHVQDFDGTRWAARLPDT